MEEFLPSEIARAVYGYLLSEGCDAAANTFLETSPNLIECKQRVKKGKRVTHANTLLLGWSLTEVLNIACSVHSMVRQAQEKRSESGNENGNESDKEPWSELFDQLRSFILADRAANVSGAGNAVSESQNSATNTPRENKNQEDDDSVSQASPQLQTQTPTQIGSSPSRPVMPHKPETRQRSASLAENYRSLVEECSEGLGDMLSPEKPVEKNGASVQLNRPATAPAAVDLDVQNQSAISAITGMTFGAPQTAQVVAVASQPLQLVSSSLTTQGATGSVYQNVMFTTANFGPNQIIQVPPSCSSMPVLTTCTSTSLTQPIMSSVISTFSQPILMNENNGFGAVNGITRLPDPPILMLNNQNQTILPFDDPSSTYFSQLPAASSTPHPQHTQAAQTQPQPSIFNAEDTACIFYPPVSFNQPRKAKKVKEVRPERQTRLRRLLPKPPRKDPPNIVHIQIMSQENDEEKYDVEECGDAELATELPEVMEENAEQETVVVEVVVEHPSNVAEQEVAGEEKEKGNEKVNENVENEKVAESVASTAKEKEQSKETNSEEPSTITDKEAKTPAAKKCEMLKKNISRSTPRRHSHVRALSFNTPLKPTSRRAHTSPKMPKIKFSPRTSKLNNVKRSSLFKSPPSPKSCKDLSRLTEEEESEVQDNEESDSELVEVPELNVPIATRSPATKLSSAWKEVNDVTITQKPQWDDKIRSFIRGDFIDPDPPPKKESTRKSKKKPPPTKKEAKRKSKKGETKPRRSTRLTKNTPLKSETDGEDNNKSKTPPKSTLSPLAMKNGANKSKIPAKRGRPKKVVKISPVKPAVSDEVSSSSNEMASNTDKNLNNEEPQILQSNSEETEREIIGPITEKEQLKASGANNNVLLEDLVVSSNSCFPQVEEVVNVKDKTVLSETVPQELAVAKQSDSDKSNSNHPMENTSPIFVLPSVPMLDTPLKESLEVPSMVLTTPLLKTIRQETSVLEEDLLLTPSLPPTPQVNSPRYPAITPCKVLISACSASDFPVNTPGVKNKSEEKSTLTKKKQELSDSSDEEVRQINFNKSSNKDKPAIIQGRESTSSKKQIILSSSTDTSSEATIVKQTEQYIKVNNSNSSNAPKIRTRVVPQVKEECVNSSKPNKNSIYTTTDSSDEETRVLQQNKEQLPKTGNNYKQQHLSKLASLLLEKEKKMCNIKNDSLIPNKKQVNTMKKSPSNKTKIGNCFEKKSSLNEGRKTNNSKTGDSGIDPTENNKTVQQTLKGKFPRVSLNSKSKDKKTQSPEEMRQQLQYDLLKRERQIIFGDEYPSSSDSETDTVFEKKKVPIKQTKAKKSTPVKKCQDKIVVPVDNSSTDDDDSDKHNESKTGGKSVRFQSTLKPKTTKEIINSKNYIEDKAIEKANSSVISRTREVKEKITPTLGGENSYEVLKAVEQIEGSSVAKINYMAGSNEVKEKKTNESGEDNNEIKRAVESISSTTLAVFQSPEQSISEKGNSSHLHNDSLMKSSQSEKYSLKQIDNSTVENKPVHKDSPTNIVSPRISSNKNSSADINSFADVSSSMDDHNISNVEHSSKDNENKENDHEKIEKRKIDCCIQSFKEDPDMQRPSTPFNVSSSQQMNTPEDTETEDLNESEQAENHVVVVSNTIKSMKSSNFMRVSELDPNHKILFAINDDRAVTLSYSKSLVHFQYPIENRGGPKKNIKTPTKSPRAYKSDDGKRRITLTPVGDNKYEKKLKVTYDVIDEKIIRYPNTALKAFNPDILEVSCSTIDADSTAEESNRCLVKIRDQQITDSVSAIKNVVKAGTDKSCLSDLKSKEGTENKNESFERNCSHSSQKSEELRFMHSNREISPLQEARQRIDRRRIEEHSPMDDHRSHRGDEKRRSRHDYYDRRKEKDSGYYRRHSPIRSFERYEHERRYHDRRRSEDRRGYLERRHSSGYYREEHPTISTDGRRDYVSKSSLRIHNERRPHRSVDGKTDNKPMHYADFDAVEKSETKRFEEAISRFKISESSDPRASQVVTYSDIEREESSNDAGSLMDFAVLARTKNKRPPGKPDSDSVANTKMDQLQSSQARIQTPKRKVSSDGDMSLETDHASKKLNLGEVDMKEAKSVLKHKMVDMLNALHPDTSNDAS